MGYELFASAVLDHVEVEAVSVFSTCLRLENRFDYFARFALFNNNNKKILTALRQKKYMTHWYKYLF